MSEQKQIFCAAKIRSTLEELAVNLHNRGGIYLIEIIEFLLLNEEKSIADALELLAQKYGITVESVRASVRYAVYRAWSNGNAAVQHRYFFHSVEAKRRKPTESAFVTTLVQLLRHELNEFPVHPEEENSDLPLEMRNDIFRH